MRCVGIGGRSTVVWLSANSLQAVKVFPMLARGEETYRVFLVTGWTPSREEGYLYPEVLQESVAVKLASYLAQHMAAVQEGKESDMRIIDVDEVYFRMLNLQPQNLEVRHEPPKNA